MPHPLLPSSSTALKQRLLSGASAAVIVLALSVAVPTGAVAQEIQGPNAGAATLFNSAAPTVDIISGDTGDQFGAIDVDGGLLLYRSITLTQSETISVFDSGPSGTNAGQISGNFEIASSAIGTLVFARSDTGGVAGHAGLQIAGNLEGLHDTRGGNLSISAFDQFLNPSNNASSFQIRGSTYMGALSVAAGNGVPGNGGNMSASFGFGSNDDTFDAFGLTVTGGNGNATDDGGDASSSVSVDGSNNNTAIFGAGGIIVTAGDGGTDGDGGLSRLTVVGNATIDGAVTITGGDEGTGTGDGGNASIDFNDEAGTVTFANALTITTGSDTGAIAGAGGNAEAIFASTAVNANGGVVLSEQQDATATLTLDGTGLGGQTFNGTIMAANDGDGVINVENGSAGVTFTDAIGSSMASIGTITLTDGDLVDFNGDVFADEITITSATAVTEGIFNGGLTIGANDLTVASALTESATAEISASVGGVGEIILDTINPSNHGERAEVDFTGDTAFTVANAILGQSDREGLLSITNTAGVTFDGRIGAYDLNGDRQLNRLSVGADAIAIFNDDVATEDFEVGGAGSTLTFNAEDMTQVIVGEGGAGVAGALSLNDGTIILGANVGNGDTVFDVTDGVDSADSFVLAGGTTQTLFQASAHVQEGDEITLIDGDFDHTVSNAEFGVLDVTDTALTDFTIAQTETNQNLVLTAVDETAESTAEALGISVEDAIALRAAVDSRVGTGDLEGLDELTTVLNADDDGASAARAAQTVGTQADTLSGASQTAFATSAEQTSTITARLESVRGLTGFSGGDLDGPYSPQATSGRGGVWGQVFGGVANADGDSNYAGYDASYGGLIAGIDGMVSEDITIGAFGSYSFSSVDGDGAGGSQIDANTFGFGVYAGYAGEGFYLDGFAAYAMSQNDLTRQDILNRTITADYDASQFSVGLAGGVPIEMSSNIFITPNASLTWNHYDADTYTETGSPLAQTVNPDAVSNLTGTIGARIHAVYENFDNDGTAFIPELRVALIGDLIDDDATASATFSGATAYEVTGTNTDDIGALIGIGLGLDNSDWAAGISYDADLRGDTMSHTGRAEFRWKF